MRTHLFKTFWNSAILTECAPSDLFYFPFYFAEATVSIWPKDRGQICQFHTAACWADLYLKLFLSEQNDLLVPQNGMMPRDRLWEFLLLWRGRHFQDWFMKKRAIYTIQTSYHSHKNILLLNTYDYIQLVDWYCYSPFINFNL